MTHPTVKPRGRPKGEFRARLSDEDVQAMRSMAAEGWGSGAIAKKFGVSPCYSGQVCKGKRRVLDRSK